MYIMKNRFGKDGMMLPLKVNLDIGLFKILNPDTRTGSKILEQTKLL